VPILDATFGIPTPTDTAPAGQTNTTDIAFQYDGVADFPEYPVDGLADLNAVAGFAYVHGDYLLPDGAAPTGTLPYGYTPTTLQDAIDNPANRQVYGDTTYVTIPATSLPLLYPLEDLAAATGTSLLVTPFIDLTQPALQVLIEIGYNRANYGAPTPFALIPPINPITLTSQLIAATQEGVNDALSNLGNPTPVPLPPVWGTESPAPITPPAKESAPATFTSQAAAPLHQPILNVATTQPGVGVRRVTGTKPQLPGIVRSDLHRLSTVAKGGSAR
jgi:PE-PPE domain